MTESDDGRETAEAAAARIAQVRAIRDQARDGGLWFEAYLPPDLAEWLLGLIERGDFVDPSEAVFVEKMNERLQELIVRRRSEPAEWPRRKS